MVISPLPGPEKWRKAVCNRDERQRRVSGPLTILDSPSPSPSDRKPVRRPNGTKKAQTGKNTPSSLAIYLYHRNHIFLFLPLEFLLIMISVRTCLVASNKILTVHTGMISLRKKSEDTRFHAGF